jgi:hypothetical protein
MAELLAQPVAPGHGRGDDPRVGAADFPRQRPLAVAVAGPECRANSRRFGAKLPASIVAANVRDASSAASGGGASAPGGKESP